MRIALVHCPLGHKKFSENLKVVDEEFCLAPPIVLAYIASILEKSGHKVIIVDANALKFTKERTLEILKKFSPHVIGFRVDTYWFHRVVEWANYFKERLGVKIIAGGINITLYPQDSLSYNCFDYGVVGEAIESLPKLVSALENNDDIGNIEGVAYKDNGKIVVNPPSDKLVSFDDYPFPARHLLPNHLYSSFTSQLKNFTIMVTSTGCPFKCTFCAISKLQLKERSPVNVVDEIEECYKRYNVREIDFFDSIFFRNKKRFIEICDEILKRRIKIEWSCRSRADVVDEDILKTALRAGCRKIYYGIESASPQVLKNINKNIDKRQIINAVEMTNRCGIRTLGFFMVGNPGDTKESILSSINFAKELKLDFVQVCRVIAKPNTDLNNILIKAYGHDYWKEYISGRRSEQRLLRPWSDLSEEDVERYLRKFYRKFYFRPSYIIRRILNIRSINELNRYIKVALKWFFCNYTDSGDDNSNHWLFS